MYTILTFCQACSRSHPSSNRESTIICVIKHIKFDFVCRNRFIEPVMDLIFALFDNIRLQRICWILSTIGSLDGKCQIMFSSITLVHQLWVIKIPHNSIFIQTRRLNAASFSRANIDWIAQTVTMTCIFCVYSVHLKAY